MFYTAIYARNTHSEMCQSKQGFFFVRVERYFNYYRSWSKWLPVIAIERNSEGHIVAKINSKDSFVYTAIEKKKVNYLLPKIGGIVNSIDYKREKGDIRQFERLSTLATTSLREAIDTLEWIYACSSPNLDEVKK